MRQKNVLLASVASLILIASVGQSEAATLLYDDFHSETPGLSATTLSNFNVSNSASGGSVDVLIGSAGTIIDICGSTAACGVLTSVLSFAAGTYQITVTLSNGSQGLPDTTVLNIGSQSYSANLTASQADTPFVWNVTTTASGSLSISDQSANPFTGNYLSSVQVSTLATPGPIAGAGLPALLALGGLAAWRRRKAA